MSWEVKYRGQAKKALRPGSKQLSLNARDAMDALHLDLEEDGPMQSAWQNYSKFKGQGKHVDRRHCHLLQTS
ncbi:MAG: hypothetical protein A2504_16310 [Bdellovibrionales bacterium RIFOXYD12_FULL_39_22]|nr:MAG: hypothetical protein A2385_08220 [Bdellovibrionales bacterium RIFOXYB1_FULL_39_21]OFZ44026.1 MAG: hypothetical protein A2485_07865 [Bdellovibrionales bacterium RIFOXYC12_FULL_39_17]OFZ50956.1 MAG: hypothetical protein A2404_07135 [Bdellovibrionales bacterium RIFOXYC1_FULL_39_130]OFZ78179.1 MAG: hypothetical protein A2560_02305 [Bdellovibrionales bacterium RIFOXYD1_FULL_39_84]OFZ94047.1 MAG: hypothetical protein A2504_16310 [Bdellovibrionales bacterium RIFOXYD12_FULL_39_22]HLE11610.1 hy